MPQGADAISRMFRDSGHWRELEGWYADYAESPWGAAEWAVGQLGTMFPSSETGLSKIKGTFATQVSQLAQLQVLAVAAQRSSAWDPDEARQAIRAASTNANHPLQRRTLALAAMNAGEERHFVRALLREFEQNDITLRMLEASSFRSIPPKADFR